MQQTDSNELIVLVYILIENVIIDIIFNQFLTWMQAKISTQLQKNTKWNQRGKVKKQ